MKKKIRNHSYHRIYPILAKIRINRGLLYFPFQDANRVDFQDANRVLSDFKIKLNKNKYLVPQKCIFHHQILKLGYGPVVDGRLTWIMAL